MGRRRKQLSYKTRMEVFERDNFTCQYCGARAHEAPLEVDHIIPWSRGGTDDIDNLTTACRSCNRHKHAKLLPGTTVTYLRGESEKAEGEPININAGEYVEIKPIIEKLGDGHVFYYEYQDQKVEIPASKEFFDLFLKAIKEVQVNRQRVNQQVVTA